MDRIATRKTNKENESADSFNDIANQQYVIELDETGTRVIEKFRKGHMIGKVDYDLNGYKDVGRFCCCVYINK